MKSKLILQNKKVDILESISKDVSNDFLVCGYSKWGKGGNEYLPCIQVGPYHVPAGEVRDEWIKLYNNSIHKNRPFKRMVYWYGTSKKDLSKAFSFINHNEFYYYEEASNRGYNQIPQDLQKKVDQGNTLSMKEQFKVDGFAEINEENALPKEKRLAWLIEFEEDSSINPLIKALTPRKRKREDTKAKTGKNKEHLTSVKNQEKTLATIKKWCRLTGNFRWSQTEFENENGNPILINLRRGGRLRILPNVVEASELNKVRDELLNCGLFRQYSIQAQDEPRLHFLLHDKAIESSNFETEKQPGYRYSSVTMKGRPLKSLPLVSELSKRMASLSGVESWTIGINPVLYRDNRDKIGAHADDDQGEEIILCLVVSSPPKPRRILICPKVKRPNLVHGDESIELILMPGDAYEMDGEMQKHYFHSIPRMKGPSDEPRMVIVFRTGKCVEFIKDSGTPCINLSPREPKIRVFGRIHGIEEGHIYGRIDLFDKCAHLMLQRGISGMKKDGCDAIIVSGLREDNLGKDEFLKLVYFAEASKGALSLLSSFEQKKAVRVFRSSHYSNKLKACNANGRKFKSKNFYRYDGLYTVTGVKLPEYAKGPYQFELERADDMSNIIQNKDFAAYCHSVGSINPTPFQNT